MITTRIEAENWQNKFAELSEQLTNKIVTIEINGLDLGSQTEAVSVRLKGIVYDPKDNIVEISCEDFEHLISSPVEIYYTQEMGALKSIEFVDEENRAQLVTFVSPLLL